MPSHSRTLPTTILMFLLTAVSGCRGGLDSIDARTDALLAETSRNLGGNALAPTIEARRERDSSGQRLPGQSEYEPLTTNPPASELDFRARMTREEVVNAEADAVIGRIDISIGQTELPPPDLELDLVGALAVALRSSREYQTAEEEYVLAALRLLVEQHRWGPRFFDEISATVTGDADEGNFDTALELVNEFRVTQRLPFGGEVSARMLARATEDLHRHVAGESVQSADFILSANVPLLRGAGLAAVESKLQAERSLIYAARSFERFRREFLVDIARDFLNLVVQQRQIDNAERQLKRLVEFEVRENRLVESGRVEAFSAALAAQDVLFAQDALRSQRESYRLSVDRFKVRLGLPVDVEMAILPSSLGLPVPETNVNDAVRMAIAYRLDLQTQRDRLEDARRGVEIAFNEVLPDLNMAASASLPTDRDRRRAGLRFDPEESAFSAGVTFGLPLDREIERLGVRSAQINAAQAERSYDQFRDNLIVTVRDSVREIERSLFSIRLQQENIRIAEHRMRAIDVAPDQATARDRSEAADGLTRAEDGFDRAVRDLEVAILEYLLSTGTLRVNQRGAILPLNGMDLPGIDLDQAGNEAEVDALDQRPGGQQPLEQPEGETADQDG
ncbi:MAG: TolC family protein [Phycisphaerales bacterium]